MRALFVARASDQLDPWYPDFEAAVKEVCEHSRLDPGAALAPQFEGVEAVVDLGGHGSPELVDIALASGVRLWQVLGTGLDGLDVSYLTSRGMQVANTPGRFSAVALAEHALFLMLALAKRYPEARAVVGAGRLPVPTNRELAGATLCILGLGASGRQLAVRAAAMGMNVDAIDVQRPPAEELTSLPIRRFATLGELPGLLAACDYLSVHVPLTGATRQLINDVTLAHLQPTASLINVSRGDIVDERALITALEGGRLAGAGLDVFSPEPPAADNPLLSMPNVVTTPHVAGATAETSRRRAAACAENIRRLMAGEPLRDLVAGSAV